VTRRPSSHALLDLPASFWMTPGTFEGLPAPARLGVGLTNSPALVTFSSPSKIWSDSRCPWSVPFAGSFLAVLASVQSLTWAPLMGLSKIAPPSALALGVHSKWSRCSEELSRGVPPRGLAMRRGATIGPKLPPFGLVPSLSFLPTSTVCSTLRFTGLLHPETDHGVRHVSGRSVRAVGQARSFVGRSLRPL
jgi:hypothetical protein